MFQMLLATFMLEIQKLQPKDSYLEKWGPEATLTTSSETVHISQPGYHAQMAHFQQISATEPGIAGMLEQHSCRL
jgi:hypothetical protein